MDSRTKSPEEETNARAYTGKKQHESRERQTAESGGEMQTAPKQKRFS